MKWLLRNLNIKRTVFTVLGVLFLLLGFLGLFLPILQGFLFLAIGFSILAAHNPFFERLKQRAYNRFPRAARFSENAKSGMRRMFHRPAQGRVVRNPVVYYVSSHGYGHSVRSCDVIRSLRERQPDLPVIVRSATAPAFFESRLQGVDYSLVQASFDVGLVQRDSLRADLETSLDKVEELIDGREELVAEEAAWLSGVGAGLIVADIPAIPIAAAKRIGVPALAVANFSWDWIYAEFAERDQRWQRAVDSFAEDYSKADLLLRLPFSPAMGVFPRQMDVGLLADVGRDRRAELAKATGADPEKRWVLICFWSLEWSSEARSRIGKMDAYEFFVMPEIELGEVNTHMLGQKGFAFSDIVASVDAVLSKPGYGILSDCIANGKPLAYAERADFREYAVLVESIRKYLRNACISMEDLYAGRFEDSLDSLWGQDSPQERIALDGAQTIAEAIIRRI